MKIAVLGAGTMGAMAGGRLVRTGNDVCLIDVWKDHIDAINNSGLKIYERDTDNFDVVYPKGVQDAAGAKEYFGGAADLIIVFVKGMHTDSAMASAGCIIDEHTRVLTVQNGIGNPEIINKYVAADKIYFGCTSTGAVLEGPGVVRDFVIPDCVTYIMPLDHKLSEDCENVAKMLTESGIKTFATLETELHIWEKLTGNGVGNALSAITRLNHCDLFASTEAQALTQMIIEEICAVANAKGIDIKPDGRVEKQVAFSSQLHKMPSMGYDVMNKKQTEIETINGEIMREGERLGVPTPGNKILYCLVRMLEQNYDNFVF